jgi:hypothetical protein
MYDIPTNALGEYEMQQQKTQKNLEMQSHVRQMMIRFVDLAIHKEVTMSVCVAYAACVLCVLCVCFVCALCVLCVYSLCVCFSVCALVCALCVCFRVL